jgi:hypothetical protein
MITVHYEGPESVLIVDHYAAGTVGVIPCKKAAEDKLYNYAKNASPEIGCLRTAFGLTFYGEQTRMVNVCKELGLTYDFGHV